MGASTQEALMLWNDLVHDMSHRWSELMEDKENWSDLPPDAADALVKASRAFADAGETILEHLGVHISEE